jgi:hypothetical protein
MRLLFIAFILLMGWLSHGFTQALPDSAFNARLRKFNGGWIAGDATFSIALPGQKTLWLFGDSFIGAVKADQSIVPGARMIRNCAILQDGDSLTALFGGTFDSPRSFVETADEQKDWFWPEQGLLENDTLKIFFSEFIQASGPAGFNFKYKAANLVRFTYPGMQRIDIGKLPYYDRNGVCYGNSVLVEDGYTYIYGRKEPDTVYHIPYPHVARVPAGNIQAPWEFYDGSGWTPDPVGSARISTAAVSQEFGVFRLKDLYVMLSQEIWFSKKIYSYTSSTPLGPWVRGPLLYETPILFANTFTYNAFPHPQFNDDDGLLVSYNTNGNFADIFKNVEVYRPRFIRIPFSMIHSSLSSQEIQKKNESGDGMTLDRIYPNPAIDEATVNFTVTRRNFVSLRLCTITGQEVGSFVNRILDPGNYHVDLDLRKLSRGLYRYRLGSASQLLIKN